MGYTAGNLELSILGFSEKAVASIDVTAKALNRLASSIDKINSTQFVFAGEKLEVIFTKIAKATNSINTNNIINLASVTKSLSSISKLSNLNKIDFAKISQGFETLTVSITPFLNKVKESEASLTALYGTLKMFRKVPTDFSDSSVKNRSSIFGFLNLSKWVAVGYTARKLGQYVSNIVQAGSDYTEVLNLWQVAMRNNLDTAEKFINKIQQAYGISSKTLMNAQATFRNMIGSLGQISDDVAYKISESLVLLSADFASLYNTTISSAFEKMQAMLAGQVRPIRSAGLDITETTLYQFYQQIGGTKAMRQLNRTEKQLLSILAVYKQMEHAGATGDMAKTLNFYANQARMVKENFVELKTWTGIIIKDFIDSNELLIKTNALLITASTILKLIAQSKGLGKENFLADFATSAEGANEEIDKLQGKLLDFDKIRSLQDAGNNDISIDKKLLEALVGYESKLKNAQGAAQELAEEWLNIIGITKDANGNFMASEQTLDDIQSKINLFSSGLSSTFAFFTANKFFENTWISALISLLVYGYTTNENFRESIHKLADALGSVLSPIINAIADVLPIIINSITPIINFFAEFIIFLDDIGMLEPILWGIFTAFSTLMGIKVMDYITNLTSKFKDYLITLIEVPGKVNNTLTPLEKQKMAINSVVTAMTAMVFAYSAVSSWLNSLDGDARKTMAWATILVAAFTAIAVAAMAMHGALTWGTAVPVILAAVGAGTAGIQALVKKPEMYATGASDINDGTVFVAGEMGKTEMVYNGNNGKSNVANVQQIAQATYAGTTQALNDWWARARGDMPQFAPASDSGLYERVTAQAGLRGDHWSK